MTLWRPFLIASFGGPDREPCDLAGFGRTIGFFAGAPGYFRGAHGCPRTIHPQVQGGSGGTGLFTFIDRDPGSQRFGSSFRLFGVDPTPANAQQTAAVSDAEAQAVPGFRSIRPYLRMAQEPQGSTIRSGNAP